MTAAAPLPSLVWYRYGSWPAHLRVDGAQACKTEHGRFPSADPESHHPTVLEGEYLTPHGQPYGRICAICQRAWQRQRGISPHGFANRIYPQPKPGDVFGDRVVVALAERDPRRYEERVRWRCVCGTEGETYTSNLRVYARQRARCAHRVVRVGTSYGDRTVTELLGSERARWRCVCGTEGESSLHDLRRGSRSCRHSAIVLLDVCECGGHRDAHGPRGGACFDDDCACDERPEGACVRFRGASPSPAAKPRGLVQGRLR